MKLEAPGPPGASFLREGWPEPARGQLYECRDLKPTTALDALIAGALAQHDAIEKKRAMAVLFPDAPGPAIAGKLIRA